MPRNELGYEEDKQLYIENWICTMAGSKFRYSEFPHNEISLRLRMVKWHQNIVRTNYGNLRACGYHFSIPRLKEILCEC